MRVSQPAGGYEGVRVSQPAGGYEGVRVSQPAGGYEGVTVSQPAGGYEGVRVSQPAHKQLHTTDIALLKEHSDITLHVDNSKVTALDLLDLSELSF